MVSISVNGYFDWRSILTNFPSTVIPRRMGRPPLNKDSKTTLTGIRLTDDTRERIIALVGANRMAAFIREAIDGELDRRERAAGLSGTSKPEDDSAAGS